MLPTDSVIDLRSDTVTRPSQAMIEAMSSAVVGDDVYGDDPTVNQLEQEMSELTGMESAMFVSSGTQSNLCALLSHLQRGEQFIIGADYHVFKYEACGSAVLGGLAPQPISIPSNGQLSWNDVLAAIAPDDYHFPISKLLSLENTFNGMPIPLSHQNMLAQNARQHGLIVHLDGARAFNAIIALDISMKTLCEELDSISICLSKGLGAPVGSVLCGSAEFIAKARRYRKMLGGGLRQAGLLAACGLVALRQEVPRLGEDHDRAQRLALALQEIDGINVPEAARTNMVYIEPREKDADAFHQHLERHNILINASKPKMRLVMHRDIDDSCVQKFIDACASYYRMKPV
jgi:threonine aldolase